jgi:putative ABC transport system permease protein
MSAAGGRVASSKAPPALLAWLIAGDWRAHPLGPALAIAAIAVGVALGFGVHLVNASALDSFERGMAVVAGEADIAVEAVGPQGLDERLYPLLAELSGVADASPMIEMRARAGDRPVELLGIDVLRAVNVSPAIAGFAPGDLGERSGPESADKALGAGSAFLSRAALERTGTRPGDPITIVANGHRADFRVSGTVPGAEEGRPLVVIDIAAAQWRFGRLGQLDRIHLKLDREASAASVRRAVEQVLPPDAALVTRDDRAARAGGLSRAYRVNLQMLALVALLTGAFLTFSAQALSVARRLPHFALLRVVGAQQRSALQIVLAQGLLLGSVGSAIGVLLGYGLARLALFLVGGDLGAGYFAAVGATNVSASPAAAALFGALGILAAILGSLAPALAAARVAPAAALKRVGDPVDPHRRISLLPALLLAAAGAACTLLPPVGSLPLFGYVAIALLLASGIVAMPRLAQLLLARPARFGSAIPALDLAVKRLHGAPGQAAIALCGIVASVGLMIAMATMVTSFRTSVDQWLVAVLPADLYLDAGSGGAGLMSPSLQAAIAAAPGVADADFMLHRQLQLEPDRPAVALIARRDPRGAFPLLDDAWDTGSDHVPAWVSEPAARLYGLRTGHRLRLPLEKSGEVEVEVVGIWRDYARQHGAISLRRSDYVRLTGDGSADQAAIRVAPGYDARGVADTVRSTLPPPIRNQVQVVPAGELRRQALGVFDRSFAVTYALELVAIAVGLAGVAATISAQTIARTREFGMLRHLGVTRRQIMAMLGAEGALLGLVGGIAGVTLGCIIAQVLIGVVNPQSFNWTMDTVLPFGLFASVVLALVAASGGTAVLAGRQAASVDAVRATREDW